VTKKILADKLHHDLPYGHIDRCQICGSESLETIIDLGHQAPCDSLLWPKNLKEPEQAYPLNFVRCTECGLAQIDYVVPPEILFYSDYPYRSGITETLRNNLRATASTIINQFELRQNSLAIDIGSNDGSLLSGFKDGGMRVVGIEPTDIADIAIKDGINTIKSFFSKKVAKDVVAKYGNASAVTAANMFAHVAKLGELIRCVEYLLEDGGVFVTESHYLLDLMETVQYDSIYHEHLKYYSLKSLIELFDPYDFTVVDVERIENYAGSIRVFAVKGKGHKVSDRITELLAEEELFGLYDRPVFDKFAERVAKSKKDLMEFVVEARKKGDRVVGVGCPGRSSTLMNYCNIDTDLMPYIAEQSTSLKLGLFLPGMHTPIVDEEVLFQDPPEYVIMLSWHYWQPIVKNLRKKGLKSKIVLPLPAVTVLDI
jgi:hypothetical protein